MRNNNKINPLQIYESLWRCRDFELSHLWQRSVFLTAFIVLAYTGYGFVAMEIYDCLLKSVVSGIAFWFINAIGFLIAASGIVVSAFWIMMGKGSKAWYERYESALYKIERDRRFITKDVTDMDESEIMHGSLPEPARLDDNLWSTDAGSYSPSRINILLGQLSALIFTLGYLGQAVVFAFSPLILGTNNAWTYALLKFSLPVALLVIIGIVVRYTPIGRTK